MKKSSVASAPGKSDKGKGNANTSKVLKKPESFPASWITGPPPKEIEAQAFLEQRSLTVENSAVWSLKPDEHAVTRLRQTVLAQFQFKSELFNPEGLLSVSERLEILIEATTPTVRTLFKVTTAEHTTERTDLGQIMANHAAFLDSWNESVHLAHSIHDYEGYGLIPSIRGRAFGRSTSRMMLPNIISSIVFIDRVYFSEITWPNRIDYFNHIVAESAHYSHDADQLTQNSSPIYYASDNLVPNSHSAPWICR